MRTEFLREFATLANYGNFHAAAEKLFISQPTLSNHIKTLENELGFELFDRSRNNELTAAGSLLLDGTQAALANIDAAVEACHRLLEEEGNAYPPSTPLCLRFARRNILRSGNTLPLSVSLHEIRNGKAPPLRLRAKCHRHHVHLSAGSFPKLKKRGGSHGASPCSAWQRTLLDCHEKHQPSCRGGVDEAAFARSEDRHPEQR